MFNDCKFINYFSYNSTNELDNHFSKDQKINTHKHYQMLDIKKQNPRKIESTMLKIVFYFYFHNILQLNSHVCKHTNKQLKQI